MSTVTASNKDLSSTLSDMFSSKPSTPSSNTYEPGAALNSTTGNTDTGFFSSMSWQTWLIIILVLALLGFNVFIYLAKGTGVVAEFINKYFGPLLKLFGISVLETTKQTVNVTATGTKAGVDVVANTTTGVINAVESIGGQQMPTSQQAPSSQKNSMPVQTQDESSVHQNTLDNSLNHSSQNSEPRPDESSSSYGKAGWCYIGEDNNTRTCAEVGVNDRCMSGDIFPSQQICMNPNLRA